MSTTAAYAEGAPPTMAAGKRKMEGDVELPGSEMKKARTHRRGRPPKLSPLEEAAVSAALESDEVASILECYNTKAGRARAEKLVKAAIKVGLRAAALRSDREELGEVRMEPEQLEAAAWDDSAALDSLLAPKRAGGISGSASAVEASAASAASTGAGRPSVVPADGDGENTTKKMNENIGAKWLKRLGELQEYMAKHNGALAKFSKKKRSPLYNFVTHQRSAYSRKELSSEKIRRLEAIGFTWTGPKRPLKRSLKNPPKTLDRWTQRIEELRAYKEEHGSVRVPRKGKYKALSNWLQRRRSAYWQQLEGKPSTITQDQINELEGLGVVLERTTDPFLNWDEMLENLTQFKQEQGHCKVPRAKKDLANWIILLRREYDLLQKGKESNMTQERIKALEELGLVLKRSSYKSWDEQVAKLRDYREAKGNANVPFSWKEDGLGRWCAEQRSQYRKHCDGDPSTMTPGRIKKLAELDFDWKLGNRVEVKSWDERYEALNAYKKEHGDTNVPKRWKTDESLASWVSNQRKEFRLHERGGRRKSSITPDRIRKLEELGFEWFVGPGAKKKSQRSRTDGNELVDEEDEEGPDATLLK